MRRSYKAVQLESITGFDSYAVHWRSDLPESVLLPQLRIENTINPISKYLFMIDLLQVLILGTKILIYNL